MIRLRVVPTGEGKQNALATFGDPMVEQWSMIQSFCMIACGPFNVSPGLRYRGQLFG